MEWEIDSLCLSLSCRQTLIAPFGRAPFQGRDAVSSKVNQRDMHFINRNSLALFYLMLYNLKKTSTNVYPYIIA